MSDHEPNPFFAHPILNSPYEHPKRHWELDKEGQPTQQIVETRRRAEFITPVPKPKKRQKKGADQQHLVFNEGKGLSSEEQQYDPTPIINEVRSHVNAWRDLSPNLWQVTPETTRLLQHWRWPRGVPALDDAAHLAHRPIGRVAVLGQVPRPRVVHIVAHGVGQFLTGVPFCFKEALEVVLIAAEVVSPLLAEDYLVEADAIALGVHVKLAHRKGLVPSIAKNLGHGRQGRVHLQMLLEDAVAVRLCRGPRHESAPRRDAGRRGRVRLGVVDAVGRQLVQCGRKGIRS